MATMDDDEDPVDLEVNVHLSKTLANSLYLLQYPVRPSFMTYDNVEILSGKVKPNQKKLELEVSLNTRSKHYSKSKGEQFALNVDGRNPDATAVYSSNMMDKQVLLSHACGTDSGRYAVGYFRDGELYLSPVRAQVQMKPSFNYLDKSDTRAESKIAAQEGGDSSQDEGEEEAKAVTVKFARPESDLAKARRLASFGHMKKMQEEEAWVPLRFSNTYTESSERELRMLSQKSGESSNEFHVESTEYLKMLMSHADEVQHEKPAMPNNVLSLTQLKSMPLSDQVKALLTNAKVIRFNQLLHLLPQGTDPQATLRAIQIVAVLVQGCWVVKSEVLYPKDGCSPNSGISSELLCRGRDFVMWRFTMTRCVTRKEIASIVKLPSEDVKDILEQMSHIKVNHGWEFVFEHDYDFTDRYPEIVERQNMLWDAKFQTLSKQLNISEAHEKKIREIAAAEAQAERPRRRRTSRTRKRTLSGRSISDHSDMETESFDIDQLLKDNKTKSVGHNHNSVLNGATMEISHDHNDSDKVSEEFRTELRGFIKEKLYSRYVLSMSELKRLLNMKLSQAPPGYILSGRVTDELCEQTVIEIGGIVLATKWQEEPMFMFSKTGDELEPVRTAICDLAKTSNRMVKKTVLKNAEAMSGKTFTENTVKNVLRDYCVNKNAQWYLKCSIDTSS
ncbi:DNA-directed RNA polymerase III subunit RPC5-like isoform X2 [Mercenaria mercenaria]|uniref:DNA-directed RNA polymerase III subunit RPC5-like isoform X2 n=1 Tax=Mercenaria mercenaria TaxID=6596 RepID=UPI00234FA01B|nr:DNA-directed RNA polymerase III subunit RPC5-like isoform X2 [Mercenaria mercenaria]